MDPDSGSAPSLAGTRAPSSPRNCVFTGGHPKRYCARNLVEWHIHSDRVSSVIEFHLDTRSGVAPYMQLIQQVRRAMRLGLLSEGDQLPTVKDVVAKVAINPNTVLKAYRELEHEGLVSPRPGLGT